MPLDYIEFSKKIKTKYPEYSDVDDLTLAKKMVEKYPEYKNEVTFGDQPVKKKEVSQSMFDQGGISSAMSKMAQNQPSVSSVEKPKKKKEEIFTGYTGKEEKKYKLDSDKGFSVWKEYSSTDYDKKTGKQVDKFEKQITDPTRVAALNKQFGVDASTDPIEQIYTNYSEDKKDNEYRISNNQWQRKVPGATEWTNIINKGSIEGLNNRYNKNIKFNPEAEYVKPEPKLKFTDVNTSLVGKTEEAAADILSKKYSKYGFTFEQTGYGTDYIIARSKDGKETTVSFDEKNPEEALKLRTFLEQNASKQKSNTATTLENKIKDFNSNKYASAKGPLPGQMMDENKDLLEYIKSDEYTKELEKLTYDEVKDQFEEFVKPSFSKKSDLDEIYKSKAYGVYKNKKKAEFAGRNSKVDALYTELRSVSGDAKKEKEIKAKITSYLTDDVIQDQVKSYSMQLNDLNNAAKKLEKEKKDYIKSLDAFNGRVPSMTKEQYDIEKQALDDKAESIATKSDSLMVAGKSIQKDQKKLNIIAGEYVTEKSKAGSFGGGLVNSFLNGVSKTFLEVPYELGQSVAFSSDYFRLSPEEKKFYKDKGYSEDQVRNLLKNKELKDFKSGTRKAIVDIAGADQTTEEYMKSEDRGFFEKAIYGVAESAPAMLLGAAGATASFAGLAAQSYSSIEDEMLSDPDFETSSAQDRAKIAVPYSILMGVLENYGLKNTIKGESFTGGLMKNIMVKVADKLPANATRETLEALYNKEIKSLIGKGVFKIINGAVAEFETGATQALVLDIGLKSVYNKLTQSGMTDEQLSKLSGGELFATPDTFGEVASTVLEDGLAEAIGGATISTFSTVASGLINGNISLYNEKDLEFLKEVAGDKGFKGLIVANLKSDMLKGKLTKSEAQEKLQAMNELESTINSVPDNLSPMEQIDSVNMIAEKNRLTKEIQGKDPALVAAQTERINEINEELKKISKNAVQVQTTSEVPLQPEARVGEEVVQGESETEPQGVTEEGQKEVEVLRAKEQEEIRAKFPDAEYKADGKIDADKLSAKDRKAFDKIYAKYDKLISPLLEAVTPQQDNRTLSDQDNLITQESIIVQEEPVAPKLTKEEIQRNNIVSIQQEYNSLTDSKKKGKQGRDLKQRAFQLASKLNYTLKEDNKKMTILNEFGKRVTKVATKEEIADQEPNDIVIAKAIIEGGILNWNGDPLSMRWDSQLSWADIRKGQKDISEGKYTTQPAKRLIIELNNQYKSGDFNMMQGSGKFINKTGIPVPKALLENAMLPIPAKEEDEIMQQRADEEEQFVASEMIQEKTNLGRVYDYLDKLDKILDETLAPDKLNDITRVLPAAVMKLIVKALKVSVQSGMTLEQAIKDYAQKNNIEEKQITDSLYNMTDYQNKKTRERVTGEKQSTAKVSKEAKEAKEIAKQKETNVTVNEMAALKDQIRLEARAARQAKADLNAKRKGLADVVRAMSKAGKIKAQQADFLIKRISYLNLDNPVMVDRFVDYAGRVFERAEYQDILSKAFKVRADIRKLLKTKNQAQVVGMAKAFSKIDPSMVDDIDTYMEMADKVKNAVKPSRIKDFDVALKEATNIENISEYTKDEITRQEEIKKKELLATHDYLKEISGDMSLKDIQDIINILKEDPEVIADKEEKIKNFLINRFNLMSGIVQTMFDKGIDPMTGEQIEFDEKQKELMRKVIKMDLNEMSVRDAITIVEGVENFLENNITSGLEAAVSTYEGDTNVKSLVARGKKAREMNLVPKGKVIEKVVPKFRAVKEATGIPAASRALGRLYGEQFFSIPLMFEKMFGGVMNAGDVMNKIGFTKLINGVSNAVKRHAMIVDSFAKQDFYTKKIMNAANVYEVGMVAYLKRSKPGTPQEIKAEFNEKVNKLRKSIKNLIENGSEKEVKMGKIYQEVFNKLNVDSMDIDVILANTSDNNLKAIDWWIEQWGGNYSDLSDISLSVYNTELGSDLNYTPVSINNLSTKGEKIESGSLERGSSFGISTNYTDKKKTGVLMEATGAMGKDQYVNLDFFNNNSNALKGALIDINTASAIRQIDGAMKSEAFRKLIPSNDDRALLEKRLNNYIRRAKGKKSAPKDTIKYLSQFFNYISTLGVGKALGSVAQAVMQTAPMISTIINAGRFDIATKDFNDWLDRTGMSVSNRGLESQSTIESIDKNLEAVNGTVDSILKFAAKANTAYLKFFLSNVDVMVARSAFKSYYLQDLKRRGISTDIDWNTHEVNQESADYADQMVTRQQNVSDPLLAGEFLASDDPTKMLVRKVILPFASFILNQKARMYNDLHTAFSPTSTNEDRVIALRSFVGLLAELTAFQGMGFGIRTLYSMIADYTLGGDDEEEEKKKSFLGWKVTNETYNATKYPVKSIFNDLISPIPIADGLTTAGLNSLLGQIEYLSEKEIKDAVNEKNRILEIKRKDPMSKDQEKEFIENLKEEAKYQVFSEGVDKAGNWGMLNIAYDTYKETSDIIKLSDTGEFMDDYQGRETLKKLLPAQKESLYYDSKIMIAFSLGILPKDFATVVKKRVSKVKKKAVTEKQYERFDEVQKELGRDLKSWEIDMVKDKKEVGTAVDELNFVKRNGGLTESQGREYVKLVKLIGSPTVSDLERIKRGEKADQILK